MIVATQLLELMTSSSIPTRAEASDAATAVCDGADAIMPSAESASGKFPRETVAVMDRIIREVKSAPHHRAALDASHQPAQGSVADAVFASKRLAASLTPAATIVTYTLSGYTSLRAARERRSVRIVCMTPELSTAQRLAMGWGEQRVFAPEHIKGVPHMVLRAGTLARGRGFVKDGDNVLVAAGMPFGTVGTTNFVHVAKS